MQIYRARFTVACDSDRHHCSNKSANIMSRQKLTCHDATERQKYSMQCRDSTLIRQGRVVSRTNGLWGAVWHYRRSICKPLSFGHSPKREQHVLPLQHRGPLSIISDHSPEQALTLQQLRLQHLLPGQAVLGSHHVGSCKKGACSLLVGLHGPLLNWQLESFCHGCICSAELLAHCRPFGLPVWQALDQQQPCIRVA